MTVSHKRKQTILPSSGSTVRTAESVGTHEGYTVHSWAAQVKTLDYARPPGAVASTMQRLSFLQSAPIPVLTGFQGCRDFQLSKFANSRIIFDIRHV